MNDSVPSNSSMDMDVTNRTEFDLDKNECQRVVNYVLDFEDPFAETLSIAFVGKEEMTRLHEQYYGKSGPTDVLSFAYDEKSKEVILCPAEIEEQARDLDNSVRDQLVDVLVHGVLHLIGYDHTSSDDDGEHFRRQNEIMESIPVEVRENLLKSSGNGTGGDD